MPDSLHKCFNQRVHLSLLPSYEAISSLTYHLSYISTLAYHSFRKKRERVISLSFSFWLLLLLSFSLFRQLFLLPFYCYRWTRSNGTTNPRNDFSSCYCALWSLDTLHTPRREAPTAFSAVVRLCIDREVDKKSSSSGSSPPTVIHFIRLQFRTLSHKYPHLRL